MSLALCCVLYWHTYTEIHLKPNFAYKASHSDSVYVKLLDENSNPIVVRLVKNPVHPAQDFIRKNPKREHFYVYKITYKEYTGYHASKYGFYILTTKRLRQ